MLRLDGESVGSMDCPRFTRGIRASMKLRFLVVLMLVAFEQAQPGHARQSQTTVESIRCVGDCGAVGRVAINNIITLVNIVLGIAVPSACGAGIPNGAALDISLIIQAVNNALNDCVPPPTVPSMQPTPTATATPPVADVTGVWREDQLQIVSSDCNAATANVVTQAAGQIPAVCDTQLSQVGDQVHAVDCQGSANDGTVDTVGNVQFAQQTQTQTFSNGCMLTVGQNLSFDASHSPTTGMYTLPLTFSGPCAPFASCTAHLQSRLTRQ